MTGSRTNEMQKQSQGQNQNQKQKQKQNQNRNQKQNQRQSQNQNRSRSRSRSGKHETRKWSSRGQYSARSRGLQAESTDIGGQGDVSTRHPRRYRRRMAGVAR
jgi:hypothetical protein